MEIIQNFGLNPFLLLAQIVNFLILVYLLNRFFFKKILAFLKAREEKIKGGLAAAQKGEKLLVEARTSQKEILHQAHEEANTLLVNTQRRGQEVIEVSKDTAKKEAERIVEEAKRKAQEEALSIEQKLKKQTVRIAISILEKTLANFLTTQEHKKIINNLSQTVRSPL